MSTDKIFALIDCNSFYASCEKIFRPDLKDKPVIVLSNNDGIIVALSKEAKQIGIKRGTPLFKIEDIVLKNEVAVFSSNYTLYGDISARIMSILHDFTPDVEIYSIDEAFLELTNFSHLDLNEYAKKIKYKVETSTGVPVSIGIAPTKALAKLANKIGKKYKCYNGVFDIRNHPNIYKILSSFDVSDVWGIGYRYTKFLHRRGINTILELINQNDSWIKKNLTIQGVYLVWELRGISCHDIQTIIPNKKNILSSRSFGRPISLKDELKEAVAFHCNLTGEKLRSQKSLCKYVTIFICTNRHKENLPQYYNSITVELPSHTSFTPDLIRAAYYGLDKIFKQNYQYKKTGILLGGIIADNDYQMQLFDNNESIIKKNKLMFCIDKINNIFGKESIIPASFERNKSWGMLRVYKSPDYTTSWGDIPFVKSK